MADNHYDAIVVGSGISGGWAAKELTEKGLKVLMLERGRNIEHVKDYVNAMKEAWDFPHRNRPTQAMKADFPVLMRDYGLAENLEGMWANEQDSPYIETKRFDWFRGYHVGGRSLLWGAAVAAAGGGASIGSPAEGWPGSGCAGWAGLRAAFATRPDLAAVVVAVGISIMGHSDASGRATAAPRYRSEPGRGRARDTATLRSARKSSEGSPPTGGPIRFVQQDRQQIRRPQSASPSRHPGPAGRARSPRAGSGYDPPCRRAPARTVPECRPASRRPVRPPASRCFCQRTARRPSD